MNIDNEYQRRLDRKCSNRYAAGRIGLFCHWGLFTGGGCTNQSIRTDTLPRYRNAEEFEAAVPDPELFATNLVGEAVRYGFRYVTLTAYHSCDAYFVLYPSRLPAFVHKASKDYISAFLETAKKADILPILYLPGDGSHWISRSMGKCLNLTSQPPEGYVPFMKDVLGEMIDRYGEKIGGFWIDGLPPALFSCPGFIHERLKDAVVIVNNEIAHDIPSMDFAALEFLAKSGTKPSPPYNRPSAAREICAYNISIPGRDFIEDIPVMGSWWYRGDGYSDAKSYFKDPHFLLKEMVCSIGQRGLWNCAIGIGPTIEGKIPEEFLPSFENVAKFLKWGGEAIYNTTGAEGSFMQPGFFTASWQEQGFCSITRSTLNPDIFYIIVTEAPPSGNAMFHTCGVIPKRLTDLRTGEEIPFRMFAGIDVRNVDWSDVAEYGAKVLKAEF